MMKWYVCCIPGVVGKSYKSDIAIDDVILSPDCLTNSSRVFPTHVTCRTDQFTCKTSGNCVANTTRCDRTQDCRDGSDEAGCPACPGGQFTCKTSGQCIPKASKCDKKKDCKDGSDEASCGGNTGKSTGSDMKGTSIVIAGVVGALVVLLLAILVTYIIVKRKREKKLHLFSVFYDPTKQPEDPKKRYVYSLQQSFFLQPSQCCFHSFFGFVNDIVIISSVWSTTFS